MQSLPIEAFLERWEDQLSRNSARSLHRPLLRSPQSALEGTVMDYNLICRACFSARPRPRNALFFVEIVFRTTVMYLYTIFLARMVGHDAIGQIGPFEFVLVIAVGSAAGDPMFYPDIGLLQGILVITVVIVLHRVTGALLQRSKKAESIVEGDPD